MSVNITKELKAKETHPSFFFHSKLQLYISARRSLLLSDRQGLRCRITGEDPVHVEKQDHGLEESLHHTLEQALYTDHEENASSVSELFVS